MESISVIIVIILISTKQLLTSESFAILPRNLTAVPGENVYQACKAPNPSLFISWHIKNEQVGSCLIQEHNVTNTNFDPRLSVFIGSGKNESQSLNNETCFLLLTNVTPKDTGEWKCVITYQDSRVELLSAHVIISYQPKTFELSIVNETNLIPNREAVVSCRSIHSQTRPILRLSLGGEAVEDLKVDEISDDSNNYNVTVSKNILITRRNNYQLLTCHYDVGDYRNVKQIFKVIHIVEKLDNNQEAISPSSFILILELCFVYIHLFT